jgi:pimeloyl-ACP methyl ester carboxylesterase
MPAVFVHGNPETSAVWRRLVEAVGARGPTECVPLSPPGFGAPVPDGFGATQPEYRDWLVAEIEALNGPVDIVGHDWGTGHVLGVLAHRPDLIRSWAIDCVGIVHPDYVWHDAAQIWQTPDAGEEMVAAMLGGDPGERTDRLAALGLDVDIAADVVTGHDDVMGDCVLKLYRSAVQPAMAELGQRLCNGERRPGLVINATEDPYAGDQEMLAEMVTALGADTEVLDGLGHWWMCAGADQMAGALVAHWA